MAQRKIFVMQMELGMMANFVYLIGCAETREAAVVDPAWEVDTVLREAEKNGYKITKAFLTHTHFDHCNGAGELVEKTDAKVYIHKEEASEIPMLKENVVSTKSGDEIKIGKLNVKFIHTPGHTKGSQCFLIDDNLVSGDTLFINACGRTDLPGGSPEELYHSLALLKKMDNKTILLPGHNYGHAPHATLAEQKKENPFLVAPNLKAFLRFMGQ